MTFRKIKIIKQFLLAISVLVILLTSCIGVYADSTIIDNDYYVPNDNPSSYNNAYVQSITAIKYHISVYIPDLDNYISFTAENLSISGSGNSSTLQFSEFESNSNVVKNFLSYSYTDAEWLIRYGGTFYWDIPNIDIRIQYEVIQPNYVTESFHNWWDSNFIFVHEGTLLNVFSNIPEFVGSLGSSINDFFNSFFLTSSGELSDLGILIAIFGALAICVSLFTVIISMFRR